MSQLNLKIEKSTTPNSEIILKISPSKEDIKKYYDKACAEVSSNIKINGFRKGHVPTHLVEQQVGKPTIQAHAFDMALSEIYTHAIQSEKIEPISMPRIDIDSIENLQFTATIPVMPEVKIKDLDKIKISVKEPKVAKSDIDTELENLQSQFQTWSEKTTASEKGDRVEIDFAGFDKDGNPIPNTESKNYPLVLGSGVFIPGFEENLEGLKSGEEKSFEVTFPSDYHAESLKNAKVTFKVNIKLVEKSEKPEINDNFIKETLKKDQTLAEYKKDLETKLLKSKKHNLIHEAENEVFEKLLAASDFTLSEVLTQEELNIIKQEITTDLQRRGQTFEAFEEDLKSRESKTFEEAYSDKAAERVRLRFIVDHILKTLDIKVTPEEIEAEIQSKIQESDESIKNHVEEYYKQNQQAKSHLSQHLLMDKLISNFIEKK